MRRQILYREVFAMENTGTVKWYDTEKGYGIIVDANGEDVFLHHTRLLEMEISDELRPGMKVSFDMVHHHDVIPSAQNVQLLQ